MGTSSFKNAKLRDKFLVAFALMSIIPLLIILYFVTNYAFADTKNLFYPSLIVLLTVWVSFLGFFLIKQIIYPIVELALQTKVIAEGKYDSTVTVSGGDELGEISEAVNTMKTKLQEQIGELQSYSKETAALNQQIQKKVETLTNLMQIGDLVTAGARLEEIFYFASEKLATELDNSFSGIFVKNDKGGYISQCFVNNSGREIPLTEILKRLPFLEKVFIESDGHLVMDSQPLTRHWQIDLRQQLKLLNVLIIPMKSSKEIVGMVMLGNFTGGLTFRDEVIQDVEAFEKMLVIGYQSYQIFRSITAGEVIDNVTGLYSRPYFENRLEDEIGRAVFYHRACSLVVFAVDRFDNYTRDHGDAAAQRVLKQIARIIVGAVPPVAKSSRYGFSEFGVVLPEKNKRETIKLAENIRSQIELLQLSDDASDKVTISAGVGENPLDGATGKEIMDKAGRNLAKAMEHGGNKVIGD